MKPLPVSHWSNVLNKQTSNVKSYFSVHQCSIRCPISAEFKSVCCNAAKNPKSILQCIEVWWKLRWSKLYYFLAGVWREPGQETTDHSEGKWTHHDHFPVDSSWRQRSSSDCGSLHFRVTFSVLFFLSFFLSFLFFNSHHSWQTVR